MFVGGVMFIAPGIKLPAAGFGILLLVLVWQYFGRKTTEGAAS
jgi:hypothetical protein